MPSSLISRIEALAGLEQLQPDLSRAGVLGGIVQRLPRDTVKGLLAGGPEGRLGAQVGPDGQAMTEAEKLSTFGQGVDKAGMHDGIAAQIEKQRTEVCLRRARERLYVVERTGHADEVFGEIRTSGVDTENDRVERLGHGVVQVTGQPVPFFKRRRLPHLFVELNPFKRGRTLLREDEHEGTICDA